MTNKQIVEDFLHFLNTKNGIITTDNYTYSYQELRNALIEYHKESAAAAFNGCVISDPDVVSKIKEQMSIYPDEDIENTKQKLIESFSKMEKHSPFMVHINKNTESETPVITQEQIEQFKKEMKKYERVVDNEKTILD